MKKWIILIGCLLLAVGLTACGSEDDAASGNSNDAKDIKTMVNDYSTGEFSEVQASITSTELIVTDEDDSQSSYELPEDEFFVSVAPFVNETHPCTDHSLTGCQGELVNKDIEVLIEDQDGKVIVDKTMTTLDNGFLDFWLPRNQTFDVTFQYDGKKVESQLSTFEEDGTCVTDLQLT